ncbi:Hypothetical protein Cul210932_0368 [Corynebacterium ulcerans]|nr:Hypothetical protein Cul210932_0368 [Corynebacterium ulcerans]ALD94100.1 Hypothetical protein Cul131001_0374 [Corynebacterium ulcerans]
MRRPPSQAVVQSQLSSLLSTMQVVRRNYLSPLPEHLFTATVP